jgi:hypothetical protein
MGKKAVKTSKVLSRSYPKPGFLANVVGPVFCEWRELLWKTSVISLLVNTAMP